ncbi:MAG: hemolysin family protein [Paracoccaceae bacterium]|jgi:putative hemolysin|nr:hemolysin family protein [Paracoccaceae bacterium]
MYLEIGIVFLLTLVNGLLAMSELAIVSARTARLQLMADRGSKGALTAIRLAADPGRFLSSVQIGITLVGVLSGAFSGATLGARLSDYLLVQGVAEGIALPLGVGSVVVAITYLSLIVGELVPKQIALRAPEAVAARVAPMMQFIATVAAPLVWVLDRSGKVILRLLGQSGDQAQQISDEEVRYIISEAETAGAMEPAETRMIAGVMRIADRSARGLMTPRSEVEMINIALDRAGLLEQLKRLSRSKLPVWEGEPDNIVGVLVVRDLLVPEMMGAPCDLRAVLCDAPVVRDGQGALDVIESLRRTPAHMVLVYDEYGHFEGIITPMNVLEAITGDFVEDGEEEPRIVTRPDGCMLVAGWMPVDEFADVLGLPLEADRDYQTVAGMVLDRMGRLPQVGETLDEGAWGIEVIDLDGRRIDKLLVWRRDRTA